MTNVNFGFNSGPQNHDVESKLSPCGIEWLEKCFYYIAKDT